MRVLEVVFVLDDSGTEARLLSIEYLNLTRVEKGRTPDAGLRATSVFEPNLPANLHINTHDWDRTLKPLCYALLHPAGFRKVLRTGKLCY